MKNKLIIAALSVCSLFSTTSCDDWLDVVPQAQVSADKIFSTPEGYEAVLRGIYISMTESSVYGQESTFGMMDVMSQYYTVFTNKQHALYEASVYNYKNDYIKDEIDAMWLNHYNSIANCNILLENLEYQDEAFFDEHMKNQMTGEALAIRAYLHLDLLRAFALNYEKYPDAMGIPYAESFDQKIHKQLKTKEVLDKIIADLDKAKELLKTTLSGNSYRFNKYSVIALQARAYYYANKKAEALACAKEIIKEAEDGRYVWTAESDFTAPMKSRDVITSKELIFALQSTDVKQNFYYMDVNKTNALVLLEPERIYTDGDDFRKYLFGESDNNGKIVSYKYMPIPGEKSYEGIIPMIRLSEMYFIAALSAYDTHAEEAIKYLQTVRKMRGASPAINGETYKGFLDDVTLEARREFLGEGQMFYWFKRHSLPIPRQGGEIELTQEQTCLPMPANEIEFGNRIEDYLK